MTANEAKKLSKKNEDTNFWGNISEDVREKIIKSCEKGNCYCIIEPSNDFETNDKPKLKCLGYKVLIIDNKWGDYCYIISWD